MPYTKPTLTELFSRVRNDIYGYLGLPVQFLRKGFIYALSKVLAGLSNGLYGYLDWILRQMFPDIADDLYVRRWAIIKNLTPIAAEKSTGNVDATGTVAAVIPVDTEIIRNDGVRFIVTANTVIDGGGNAVVPVESLNFGSDTATQAGTVMTFVSVPVGVNSEVTVDGSGLTGGRDDETTEELRERVLDSFRRPPQGGSDADHERWTKEAVDATKIWVRTFDPGFNPWGLDRCQVYLYFTMADTYANTIPQAGDVTDVQDYIDARKPSAEEFFAIAPSADPVHFNLSIVPNDTATQQAVTAQLSDLIKREQEENGTLKLSSMFEAIGQTPGLTDWTLNSPSADVTTAVGEVHTLGNVTF